MAIALAVPALEERAHTGLDLSLELLDDDAMIRRRLEAAKPAPLSE